jgi:glutathione S-transferase
LPVFVVHQKTDARSVMTLSAPALLRSSPASPFGRKIKIAASVLNLPAIEIVVANTLDPDDQVRADNPLGKIPTLVLANGSTIYDSRVILEYLDLFAGGDKIIPADPSKRFKALTMQALADGICDAALLQVYEGRFRETDKQNPVWLEHQRGKVERGLNALELHTPVDQGALPDIGNIAVACALGYLDLRFEGRWRQNHSKLGEWLSRFETAIPAYAATRVAA